MLNQNYLKVFQNQGGTITIASAEPVSDDIHDMTFNVSTITISPDDLVNLADALNAIACDIDEENRHA